MNRAGRCTLALLFAAALCGCRAGGREPGRRDPRGASEESDGIVRSNLLRQDYVGSAACARCHPAIHDAWTRSPMRRMTRLPEEARIRAPFDGASFRFKQDQATLRTHGQQRFIEVRSPAFGDHLYRVTRVIGGRHREDFAGVEVSGIEPGAPTLGPPGQELILPVSFVFATSSFRLKGYSVMVGERPGLRAGGVWNQTCIACHNTLPQLASYWSYLQDPETPMPSHQSVLVDRLLPVDRRLRVQLTDAEGLAQALREEIRFLGGDPPSDGDHRSLLAAAARTSRARMTGEHLVEVGIGCEACHGGSREHLQDTGVRPSFEPRSPFLAFGGPEGGPPISRAGWINRACARCHQVLFSRYPYTWEGGQRRSADPGGSHINSGEARDFLLGGCASQMACTTCHDPHRASDPRALARLATPAGNGVCTSCHADLASPTALRAHAHHDPAQAGGACLGCHMPRKNMGLGYALTRYHRIGSPSDPARVQGDRPVECALCHPRAKVGELIGHLERWWGKRYDRRALDRLYGSPAAPVLEATLTRGLPHEQVVAAAVLGEAGVRSAEPLIASQLVHRYPLVRHFARQALQTLRGEPVPIDLDRPAAQIAAAVKARWPSAPVTLTADQPSGTAGDDPGE